MKLSNLLLSLSLATGMFSLSACTEPGLCTRGEPGCACTEANTCTNGPCNDGMCSADGSGGTGGTPGPDEVCEYNPTGLCADTVDVADACLLFCELFCIRKEQWCATDHCPAGFCDPEAELSGITVCLEVAAGNLGDAQAACREQDLLECPNVECGDTETPQCPDEEICLTDCGNVGTYGTGGQYANDGECDDGGDGADFHECRWGHDCNGCGVRYGEAPECVEPSGCCRFTNECCGGFEGTAHCLGGDNNAHCRLDCTTSELCPDGFDCVDILRGGAPTGEKACVP